MSIAKNVHSDLVLRLEVQSRRQSRTGTTVPKHGALGPDVARLTCCPMVAASPGFGDRPSLNCSPLYRMTRPPQPRVTIITCPGWPRSNRTGLAGLGGKWRGLTSWVSAPLDELSGRFSDVPTFGSQVGYGDRIGGAGLRRLWASSSDEAFELFVDRQTAGLMVENWDRDEPDSPALRRSRNADRVQRYTASMTTIPTRPSDRRSADGSSPRSTG